MWGLADHSCNRRLWDTTNRRPEQKGSPSYFPPDALHHGRRRTVDQTVVTLVTETYEAWSPTSDAVKLVGIVVRGLQPTF
ncbi:hypothetical protein P8C59_001098 [Phyllachora maydis]|uniref:Uncharacterized protein n=1 Tax=Phyllachora maydis TaxID=1825666 RepID=A0AAD9HXP9_9PEZI|nr:hypothetical protein P8C59_001098 [Phyllachora maydis]